MTTTSYKVLGLLGYVAILFAGGFLFLAIFAATIFSSDSGPSTLRLLIGWLNIIGTPILSLGVAAYILTKTWGNKVALSGTVVAIVALIAAFLTYVLPGLL